MKRKLCKIAIVMVVTTVLLPGCQGNSSDKAKDDTTQVAEIIEDEKPTDGFAYEEKEAGIVLTEYYGSSDEVDIPSEIDGMVVIGLDSALFANSESLTRVRIPGTVESVGGGIFANFPNLIVECYDNIAVDAYNGGAASVNMLGENPECARYVQIYSNETKSLMEYQFLKDGEEGEEGTYSEGASFSIEDGEAVLTLENYNGGMIYTGCGSLTIRLVEGSVNNINSADKNECIVANGSLVIEGNGSLSMKAGDNGSGCGISVEGNMTVQDKVKMFVKTGETDDQTYGILVTAGNLRVSDSHLEVQIAQTGMNSPAILASPDMHWEKAEIQLEQCEIAVGGQVTAWHFNEGGTEYLAGRTISEGELNIGANGEGMTGWSEYVRIIPKAE